jgi:hypothetical protein
MYGVLRPEQAVTGLICLLCLHFSAERNTLIKLLVLHPYNARLWFQLGNLWMAMTGASITDCSANGLASHLSATNASINSPAMVGLDENHTQNFSTLSSCAPDSVSKECRNGVLDRQQSACSTSPVTNSGIVLDTYQIPASGVSTCTPATSVSHTSNLCESRCSGVYGNERLDSSEDWLKAVTCYVIARFIFWHFFRRDCSLCSLGG